MNTSNKILTVLLILSFILFTIPAQDDRTQITLTESECYIYKSSQRYFFIYITILYAVLAFVTASGYGTHCGQYYRTEKDLIEIHILRLRRLAQKSSRSQVSNCNRSLFCFASDNARPYSRCSNLFISWCFHRVWILISCHINLFILLSSYIYFSFVKEDLNYVNKHN